MKLIHAALRCYPPQLTAGAMDKIEVPSLSDLRLILRNSAVANQCFHYAIDAGLSHEQLLLLIIQGLALESDQRLAEIIKLTNRRPAVEVK